MPLSHHYLGYIPRSSPDPDKMAIIMRKARHLSNTLVVDHVKTVMAELQMFENEVRLDHTYSPVIIHLGCASQELYSLCAALQSGRPDAGVIGLDSDLDAVTFLRDNHGSESWGPKFPKATSGDDERSWTEPLLEEARCTAELQALVERRSAQICSQNGIYRPRTSPKLSPVMALIDLAQCKTRKQPANDFGTLMGKVEVEPLEESTLTKVVRRNRPTSGIKSGREVEAGLGEQHSMGMYSEEEFDDCLGVKWKELNIGDGVSPYRGRKQTYARKDIKITDTSRKATFAYFDAEDYLRDIAANLPIDQFPKADVIICDLPLDILTVQEFDTLIKFLIKKRPEVSNTSRGRHFAPRLIMTGLHKEFMDLTWGELYELGVPQPKWAPTFDMVYCQDDLLRGMKKASWLVTSMEERKELVWSAILELDTKALAPKV